MLFQAGVDHVTRLEREVAIVSTDSNATLAGYNTHIKTLQKDKTTLQAKLRILLQEDKREPQEGDLGDPTGAGGC